MVSRLLSHGNPPLNSRGCNANITNTQSYGVKDGVLNECTAFLSHAICSTPPTHLKFLLEASERLAIAYYKPRRPPKTNIVLSDCPEYSYQQVYQIVGERYPMLGYYSYIPPSLSRIPLVLIEDSIDDIADICLALLLVLERYKKQGFTAARNNFNNGYETHWGRHLINLRSYLHLAVFENQP